MSAAFAKFTERLRRFIAGALADQVPCAQQAKSVSAAPAQMWLETEFDQLACELFELQFAHNQLYRQLCEARGVSPARLTNWREMPAVPTAAFKEHDVSCLPPAQRTTVFLSSRTTGQTPSRHFHNQDSLAVYEAALLPWFARHVLPEVNVAFTQAERHSKFTTSAPEQSCQINAAYSQPNQTGRWQLVILSPPADQAPRSSLVHMFKAVRKEFGSAESQFFGRTLPDGAWQLDLERLCDALRSAANATRPVVLLGTAFTLVRLLDHMVARGFALDLPSGSRVVETGGYKGRSRTMSRAELLILIARQLHVPESHVVGEYGMCELSSQAYDAVVGQTAVQGRIFRFPPWARAQVVSPETGREVAEGETGLIRVFDLANVFSAVAIQTEDLAVRHADGFEFVGRAALAEPRGCSLMSAGPEGH